MSLLLLKVHVREAGREEKRIRDKGLTKARKAVRVPLDFAYPNMDISGQSNAWSKGCTVLMPDYIHQQSLPNCKCTYQVGSMACGSLLHDQKHKNNSHQRFKVSTAKSQPKVVAFGVLKARHR